MKNFLILVLLLVAAASSAQNAAADSAYIRNNFTKKEVMVPMRDGVRLFTTIYAPKDQSKKYPFILRRTPYSCAPYGETAYPTHIQNMHLVRSGYIFVFQDVRGRYMSEGEFQDVRPFNPAAHSGAAGAATGGPNAATPTDEATDTYDTVDWLLKNVANNNGRVGVMGISYPGFYATMAIPDNHPAVKAVSPQAPVTDWFIGDDFHHNGALMLMDAFSFYSGFGKPRAKPTTQPAKGFDDWKTPDNYDFYLRTGAVNNFTEKLGMKDIPFWNDLMAHPDYDDFWKARNPRPHLKNVQPAVLTVGGLFDAEDCFGAWRTYEAIEKQNPQTVSNRIVMGPWVHGGWARTSGERLGNVVFGQKTSEYYQKEIELRFFEHYLKDSGPMDLPEATVFETGSNQWKTWDTWPPKNIYPVKYYFQENGTLGAVPPPAGGNLPAGKQMDEYVSDPAKPVPYTEDVHLHRTREYMTDDQRFAARRPDVLVYQMGPLTQPITVAGTITADLWVSLSSNDADFVVKLIDVFPDTLKGVENGVPMGGYQMLVRGEIMRGRYRNSFEKPQPFVPGTLTQVRFDLPDVSHTFLPGHKLMIQVQSSWFPLADRNPQQFVNIYKARDEDFVPANIQVFHTAVGPSGVILPMVRK